MSVKQNDDLFLSEKDSDVTLVIGDYEIPAHRFILLDQSGYFQTLFSSSYIEANSDKIILKEANLLTFKHVLEYMYTGSLDHCFDEETSFREIVEVYLCAQYFMVDTMRSHIVSELKKEFTPDVLLNSVLTYSIDELSSYCTDWYLERMPQMYTKIFNRMSQRVLEQLLKTRLNATESVIFDSLVWWMRRYPVHSAHFPKMLKHIELHLLEEEELDMLFEPNELIDRTFVQKLLNKQKEAAKEVQKVIDKNVINERNIIRVVDGELKSGKVTSLPPKNYITIDLKQQFLLNRITFQTRCNRPYTVSVSSDLRAWERVIDRTQFKCSGLQDLYFEERAFRFIRIQSDEKYFNINANVEAMYTTKPFEVDPDTTFLVPKFNIMSMEKPHRFSSTTAVACLSGEVDGDSIQHLMMMDDSNIVLQFSQPYIIRSMKLLLHDEEKSSYCVEVGTQSGDLTRVFEEKDVTGWRTVTFRKQPVMFIKIIGTKAPAWYFKLYKLECPATEKVKVT